MRQRVTVATALSSPCQMPGSLAIMFACYSKSPKLTLPLLRMGEDHIAPSRDWESSRCWNMGVISAHSIFQQKGPTVLVPPTLVAAAVQRQRSYGLNYYDTLWFLHCICNEQWRLGQSPVLRHLLCMWRELSVGGSCTHVAREVLYGASQWTTSTLAPPGPWSH